MFSKFLLFTLQTVLLLNLLTQKKAFPPTEVKAVLSFIHGNHTNLPNLPPLLIAQVLPIKFLLINYSKRTVLVFSEQLPFHQFLIQLKTTKWMQYFTRNSKDKGSHHLSLMKFLHIHSYSGFSQVPNCKNFTANELSTIISIRSKS